MCPSPSRAVSDRPREGRLREAGLSGARALSRLLVALIENIGAQDKVGRRHEPGWPQGTRLAAFGPTPLGAEIERAMRKAANPLRQDLAYYDAVAGRTALEDDLDEPPRATPPAAAFAPAEASAADPAPSPLRPVVHPARDEVPTWQKPFFAAPGVRYARTPDHLLRRAPPERRADRPDRAGRRGGRGRCRTSRRRNVRAG